jgi:hypothetical protein
MCDRLVRKGLVRRHRGRSDRRAVLIAITAAGRAVVDQATARRRQLISAILARLPEQVQHEVAGGLRAFAEAAGEIPDSQWPSARWTNCPDRGQADDGGLADDCERAGG